MYFIFGTQTAYYPINGRKASYRVGKKGQCMQNSIVREGNETHPGRERNLGIIQVVGSALAAAFGVQSRANKIRDFSHGSPLQFILAGLLLTATLLLALAVIVTIVT
jgi:uncharacterized membrane protein YidH (DUF202 family)